MQVRKRLRLNSIVSALSVLVILTVFILAVYRVHGALETARIADKIMTCSFERLILRTDLHRTGNERTTIQLIAKHKQVGDLLEVALSKFPDSEDKKTISELLVIHQSIGKLSKTIRENREARGSHARPDKLSRELEDRLLSRLNMMVYETILLGSKLQDSSNNAVSSALLLAAGGIILVLILVSATTLINSWYMGRVITDRIGRLRDGAALIGGGDLTHRIDVVGDDEFGKLSEAFNAMTAKLRGSYCDLEREIEERKLAEQGLLEIETELVEAQNLAHVGSWYLDAKTDATTGSAELLRIFGFDPATEQMPDFYGQKGLCYPEAEWERVNAAVQITMQTGVGYKLDVQALRNGAPIWVTIRGEVLRNADGGINGLRGTVQDITDRKLAEKNLQNAHDELELRVLERTKELSEVHEMANAERQRLYDVLETLPVYVVLMTRDYYVPFANRFFRERFGESGGRRCYEYLFNRSEPCGICESFSILKTNAPHHWEWTGPDDRNYDIYDFLFTDSDGSGMILEMGIDITEQKQAEKALVDVNETLELRIAERTIELQAVNAKLFDSRRAALNMMEDADIARRRAEEISNELELRVTERTKELAVTIETLLEEMAEREKAEGRLQRLNRLYAVLSETDQAIVRAVDKESLFRDSCRIAVEQGGFILSWIGLVDEESGGVNIVAASGATTYLDNIRITASEEPAGTGPTGISIREGTYFICNDFLNDPRTSPWHERGLAHGICASASVALKEEGRVIGALTLYAGVKDFFDQQHVDLLKQVGTDVSFALDNFNREDRRRKTEQVLREETLERLRAVEALREKEQLLLQQNRLAAMGEMINNIAHQWRQPLNVLGLNIQRTMLFYELGDFNKEFLQTSTDDAMKQIRHMSQTIDDFRNFFKADKEKTCFSVSKAVQWTISLVKDGLDSDHIDIATRNTGNPHINGYFTEFCQVLLNIVLNARDVIVERKITAGKVFIVSTVENDRTIVTITDNGGGIPEEIIDRIYEPYFSTKGVQGTGIGLFMSKNIIETNMAGSITVRNTDQGAEFRIEI